jgi:hypothetical protein
MIRVPAIAIIAYMWCASGFAQCQWGDVPDQSASCTPGEAATTDWADICGREGGTYSQRHRLSQNPQTKREVLARYGVPWSQARTVEDDHDLALCAGGADTVANRWPQSRIGKWNAGQKDKLEALTCHQLCSREITVEEAQGRFLAPSDWRTAYCANFQDAACAELSR